MKITITDLDKLLIAYKGFFPLSKKERFYFVEINKLTNGEGKIRKQLRSDLPIKLSLTGQQVGNLLTIYKKKKVLNRDNEFHPLLLAGSHITITYEKQ